MTVIGTPKKNQKYRIKFHDEEEFKTAKVLRRAGKATGKYRDHYIVTYEEPESWRGFHGEINFKEDLSISEAIDSTCESNLTNEIMLTESALVQFDEQDFLRAKNEELEKWQDMKVYQKVPKVEGKTIRTRWVLSEKNGKARARLVAKGYQDHDVTDDPTLKDSPTCSKESLRILLLTIINKSWPLLSVDVKAAFLQGKSIDRNVYLTPPPESEDRDCSWKLLKCVYGLDDASRYWYLKVRDFLTTMGMTVSKYDNCVFLKISHNILDGLVCFHVDDFLWTGKEHFINKTLGKFKETFIVGSENAESFTYLGVQITLSKNRISIAQTSFIENLCEIDDRTVENKSSD